MIPSGGQMRFDSCLADSLGYALTLSDTLGGNLIYALAMMGGCA